MWAPCVVTELTVTHYGITYELPYLIISVTSSISRSPVQFLSRPFITNSQMKQVLQFLLICLFFSLFVCSLVYLFLYFFFVSSCFFCLFIFCVCVFFLIRNLKQLQSVCITIFNYFIVYVCCVCVCVCVSFFI